MGVINAQTRWGVQLQEYRPRFTVGSRGILFYWKSLGSPENAESTSAVVNATERLEKRFSHLPKPDGINTRLEVRDRLEGQVDYIPSLAAERK